MNVPHGYPPPQYGGYHLSAAELRHPHDLPILIATWVIALAGALLLGIFVAYGYIVLLAWGAAVMLNFFSTFRVLGSAVRVSPQQYPDVFQLAQEAAARLGTSPVPVYIYQSPYLHHSTRWMVTHYFIMLSSGLVDALDPRELQFVIGQRMGAAKLGAGPMHLIASQAVLPTVTAKGGERDGGLESISMLLGIPGRALFSYWLRLRAHSYRRAGLVACQDIRSALTAIVKEMVGPELFPYMNLPALVEQSAELDRQFAARLAEAVGGLQDAMHVNQIRELLRWYRSPQYQQIAARQGKLGTGTLGYAPGGTGYLFGAVAHQAQVRKGWYAAEWDQVPPPQPPPPGYSLRAGEIRHPQEWLTMLVSWLGGLGVFVALGLVHSIFFAFLAAMVPLYFVFYFELVRNLGTMVRVTPQQFPGLYHTLYEAAARLDMPMPPTYIKQDPIVNAYAAWVWPLPRFVVVHTGLLENYSPREVQYVVGHEYGHLKCAHTPFSLFFKVTAANLLGGLLGPVAFLMKFWMAWWSRAAETSADRAGLVCTHDIRVTVAGIIKLESGGKGTWQQLNIPALLAQLERLDREPLHQLAQSVLEKDHPLALYRVRDAIRFYKSPQYQAILQKSGRPQTGTLQYAAGGTGMLMRAVADQVQAVKDAKPRSPAPAPAPVPEARTCPRCGGANRAAARFCGHCGTSLG